MSRARVSRVPTTIVLVRHAETDWNRERRFQGHADTSLNDAGRAQAAELADALAHERLSAVYSSPLRRASETAAIVASRIGLDVRRVEALREIDVGSVVDLLPHPRDHRVTTGSTVFSAEEICDRRSDPEHEQNQQDLLHGENSRPVGGNSNRGANPGTRSTAGPSPLVRRGPTRRDLECDGRHVTSRNPARHPRRNDRRHAESEADPATLHSLITTA